METLKLFLRSYWALESTRYHLLGLALISLLVAGVFRWRTAALAIFVFGIYALLTVFLMQTYEHYDLTMEGALAIVLGGALTVATVAYYVIFVRG